MNNTQYTTRKKPSLTLAIALILIFWPVGIYLMYKYVTFDKTETFKNSKMIRNLSIALFIFGILGLVSSGGDIQTIVACIFFLIGAGFMFFQSMNMKRAADRYRRYIELIVNNGYNNIDTIANGAAQNSDVVEKDLNKMISLGIFANAKMDTMRRTIEINQENKANNEQPTEAASVKCPNCGAIKGIQNGQSAECEYCGTQLKS